jgi:superfamily I DNA/RNA helicase
MFGCIRHRRNKTGLAPGGHPAERHKMAQIVWSPQQEKIFEWFEKGKLAVNGCSQHLTVEARAGTGKTTSLIEGVLRAPERRILICAFSKIIQLELQKRIPPNRYNIKAQTLHGLGLSLIRKFRSDIGIDFGSARADDLTDKVCAVTVPDAVKKLISKLMTKGREIAPHARELGDLSEAVITYDCEPEEEWQATGYTNDFVEQKALDAMELASHVENGTVIDGSDMIFLPVRNKWLRPMFDLVVVDEAQDMTSAQLEIAQGVTEGGGRMCLIGDSRQAIFGFRGADSDSLSRLHNELKAQRLYLTVTRRCGKAIVDRAKILVPDFEAHEENKDGEIIILGPGELVPTAGPGDFVLSRTNAPLVSTALQLLKVGKRTRIAGRDISKGLIALVKKLRPTSVPDFERKLNTWKEKKLAKLISDLSIADKRKEAAINSKIEAIHDQVDMLIHITEGAKNVNEILLKIEGLFQDDGMGADSVITCSSVHRAKGLEAKRVFILTDTLRNYSIEEQNIEYVAVTRAKETLFLVSYQ